MIAHPPAAPPPLPRRTLLAGGPLALLPVAAGAAEPSTVIKGTVIGKDGWLFLVWDEPRRTNAERMHEVARLVGKAVDILKAAKIETVIVLTPAKARVYREFLPDDFRFTPEGDRRYGAALDELRRLGMLVPDLAAALAAARKAEPDRIVFFKTDTHWTAYGAESAAIEVARQMKEKLHLPAGGKPGARLSAAVVRTNFDTELSKVLPREERLKYPAESYPVREPLAAQGRTALIEDEVGDVVVIGNSYMQPRFNFSPMLSNQLDRPVELAWKSHLVGPYKTLLDYLGSKSFQQQRPRVIVWDFHEIDMEIMPDNQSVWGQNAMPADVFLASLQRAVKV